jgi:hypothetical protein
MFCVTEYRLAYFIRSVLELDRWGYFSASLMTCVVLFRYVALRVGRMFARAADGMTGSSSDKPIRRRSSCLNGFRKYSSSFEVTYEPVNDSRHTLFVN